MELRLYSFVNFYLSSIQQGIQTGHCAVDLVRKYAWPTLNIGPASDQEARQRNMVADWADHHKTFIVLNGGDLKSMRTSHVTLETCGFPFVAFHESPDALGGIMTTIAVVLPESIFNARHREPDLMMSLRDPEPVYQYVDPASAQITAYYPGHRQYELIKLLKASRLAS